MVVSFVVRPRLSSSNPYWSKPRSREANLYFWNCEIKLPIANVSMLELMHQEQTTHQFLERLKSTISKFLDIYTKKASFWKVKVGDWQNMREVFFSSPFWVWSAFWVLMAGILETAESPATRWFRYVAPVQQLLLFVASLVHGSETSV